MSQDGGPREECLYCHSNNQGLADRPCPVCGTWKKQPKEARKEVEDFFFWAKIDPNYLPAYP